MSLTTDIENISLKHNLQVGLQGALESILGPFTPGNADKTTERITQQFEYYFARDELSPTEKTTLEALIRRLPNQDQRDIAYDTLSLKFDLDRSAAVETSGVRRMMERLYIDHGLHILGKAASLGTTYYMAASHFDDPAKGMLAAGSLALMQAGLGAADRITRLNTGDSKINTIAQAGVSTAMSAYAALSGNLLSPILWSLGTIQQVTGNSLETHERFRKTDIPYFLGRTGRTTSIAGSAAYFSGVGDLADFNIDQRALETFKDATIYGSIGLGIGALIGKQLKQRQIPMGKVAAGSLVALIGATLTYDDAHAQSGECLNVLQQLDDMHKFVEIGGTKCYAPATYDMLEEYMGYQMCFPDGSTPGRGTDKDAFIKWAYELGPLGVEFVNSCLSGPANGVVHHAFATQFGGATMNQGGLCFAPGTNHTDNFSDMHPYQSTNDSGKTTRPGDFEARKKFCQDCAEFDEYGRMLPGSYNKPGCRAEELIGVPVPASNPVRFPIYDEFSLGENMSTVPQATMMPQPVPQPEYAPDGIGPDINWDQLGVAPITFAVGGTIVGAGLLLALAGSRRAYQ